MVKTLEVCLKYLIKKLTVTQSSIYQTHRFDCCFYDYFIITLPKNILIENILDAFFLLTVFLQVGLTSSKRVMGKYANSRWSSFVLYTIAVIVSALNIMLLLS